MAGWRRTFPCGNMLVERGNLDRLTEILQLAMRYTEARLSAIGMEMLKQIDFDTVDFAANFDGTLEEPEVCLPPFLVCL